MKVYLVGGAVRDDLLGLPVDERDWVVIGATPEEMGAQGFKPVGRHFPVFLHPDTKEEYALARTERKTAPGYHGFEFHTGPDVKLEDDLRRRDLTINAIARDHDGSLIDPYHGRRDIENRVLRHVSPAFVEDPVRVLRVARFAARFHPLGFRVAAETISLMREMVSGGELQALVPERIWKEFETALSEPAPSRFFTVLSEAGVLASVAPDADADVKRLLQSPDMVDGVNRALDKCATVFCPPLVVFAALVLQACGVDFAPACRRLRAPTVYSKLAADAAFCRQLLEQAGCLDAEKLLVLFERTNAFRDAARLRVLLDAWCFCDFPLRAREQSLVRIRTAFDAVNRINLKRVSETCSSDIGKAVREARLQVLSRVLSQEQDE